MSRKMKDSGVPWIGEIPEGWICLKLKYVIAIRKRIAGEPGHTVLSITQNGIKPKDITSNEGQMAADYSNYQLVHVGDFAMNHMDLLTGWIDSSSYEGVTSPDYRVFEITESDHYTSDFLLHLFQTCYRCRIFYGLGQGVSGFGRWRLPADVFLNFYIPSPPVSEQQRIADFLDTQCAEIDTVLEKTRAGIEEYQKLKQSVITKAVTKGIRGPRPMKDSGVEWIGEIPEEWAISKMKYLTRIMPPCDFSQIEDGYVISFAPMECVKQGYAIPRTITYEKRLGSYTPFADGDIVMAKVTPCYENGNIAIMRNLNHGVGLGSSELITIRPCNIDSRFCFYVLQNENMKQLGIATMTGTGGLKRISPQWLGNQVVTMPHEISEQQEIADFLDTKCAEIDTLIAKKEQLITELEAYKKSLIYEYVTGKKEVPAT